jgi:hypothetical protein
LGCGSRGLVFVHGDGDCLFIRVKNGLVMPS